MSFFWICGFCLFSYILVIHGCIDEYTRKIIYLACRSNNRATAVHELFSNVIQLHGLPSRVRGDQGRENVENARFMFSHLLRRLGRGSYIATKSVHNQRIERLWVDVYLAVTQIYLTVFLVLERSGALDVSNELHLACLHYVFLPRINQHLEKFCEGWNNHPLIRHRTNYGFMGCTGLLVLDLLLTKSYGNHKMTWFSYSVFYSEVLSKLWIWIIHQVYSEGFSLNVFSKYNFYRTISAGPCVACDKLSIEINNFWSI